MIKRLLHITIMLFTLCWASCNIPKQSKPETNLKPDTNSNKNQDTLKPNTYNAPHSILFSDSNNQISQVIRTIFQDSKGNLWFGTQNGTFKLTDNILISIDNITHQNGKGVTIKNITESTDGKIWIGHSGGVSSIAGDTVTNYYETDGLISNDVWSITAIKNGEIWIGTRNGISVFNGETFSQFPLPEGEIDPTLGVSSTKMIHSILEDSQGTLWFCTNAGLFSYTNNTLTNSSKKLGIQTNFINDIIEDTSGNLWVSTKVGLYKITENKAVDITKDKVETGKGIGSLELDQDGKLWFVSNQHALYTYDGSHLVEFQKSSTNKGPVVFQIFKDQDNRLWFVGFDGAFRLENDTFVKINKNGPW
ncbi:ligand-binding sensor domain-containing protein [Bizionia sp. KMM 8389]